MPYLNQDRKPAGSIELRGKKEAVKSEPKQNIKMPPPVKIPAPSLVKA
jgi:hypothetical protein